VDDARMLLDDLYSHHLIEEPVHGRFRFHDLIRRHACSLSATDEAADRDTAVDRLFDFYVHTARAAQRHLARLRPMIRIASRVITDGGAATAARSYLAGPSLSRTAMSVARTSALASGMWASSGMTFRW
jgi:hypothetical protein